ncbi:serine/threonine protein kinase [Spiractinospora alimapuensis]|nr:serine/threonine protein kinase [Spiractinospora alimapuensis]
MGTVFAAVDPSDTPLALKLVHGEYAVDEEFRARFAREVDLLRRVDARCVPTFYGADTAARRPWLATEYVPGKTLRGHVSDHGPFTGDLLMGLAAGMAEALVAIHGAGVVHRDLKPGNVIVAPDGPKVLDFGIARAVEESAITRTGGLFGTPGWIAPEQYQGADPAAPSDMFAWGGLVAYAATGRNPFGTGATDALAYRTMEEEPDLEGLPERLRSLVTATLAKDPTHRPTAEQALSEVTRIWTGQAPSSGEEATRVLPGMLDTRWLGLPDVPTDTTSWSEHAPAKRSLLRSPKVLIPVAAVLALVLVATAGAVLWRMSGSDADPQANGGDPADEQSNGGGDGDGEDDSAAAGTEAAEDLGHGGPDLGADAADESNRPIDFSTVSTGFVYEGEDAETILLEVAEELDGGQGFGRSEPVLRLGFDDAETSGDGVRITGTADYLLDDGSYVLHAQDFRYLEPYAGNEWSPDEPEGSVYPEEDEVLLTLDADNPTGEFALTIPGVDERGGLQYVTPELWGYQPVPPDDPIPGVICFDTATPEPFIPPGDNIGCEVVVS